MLHSLKTFEDQLEKRQVWSKLLIFCWITSHISFHASKDYVTFPNKHCNSVQYVIKDKMNENALMENRVKNFNLKNWMLRNHTML